MAKYTRKDYVRLASTSFLPPIVLILAVLGSIFGGLAAPTEAASLGCLGGLAICAAYRKLNLPMLKDTELRFLRTSTFIMFLVLMAKYFMTTFTKLGGGHLVHDLLMGISAQYGPTALFAFMLLLILIFGMFMDWVGMLLVIVPIYTPIVLIMGWNPLWFAVMFCITLQISYITPPFAYSIFYLHGIAPREVSLMDIYKGCLPFIFLQLAALLIFYHWPVLSLYLPSLMR